MNYAVASDRLFMLLEVVLVVEGPRLIPFLGTSWQQIIPMKAWRKRVPVRQYNKKLMELLVYRSIIIIAKANLLLFFIFGCGVWPDVGRSPQPVDGWREHSENKSDANRNQHHSDTPRIFPSSGTHLWLGGLGSCQLSNDDDIPTYYDK